MIAVLKPRIGCPPAPSQLTLYLRLLAEYPATKTATGVEVTVPLPRSVQRVHCETGEHGLQQALGTLFSEGGGHSAAAPFLCTLTALLCCSRCMTGDPFVGHRRRAQRGKAAGAAGQGRL